MTVGKGTKQSLHQYLDNKFNQDFKKLNDALEKNLSQKDLYQIDTFLDRLPDLQLKDWDKKVSIVPFMDTKEKAEVRLEGP